MLVLALLFVLMQGDLRQFCGSASGAESPAAGAHPTGPVRREERLANAKQPDATMQPNAARPSARWSAKVDATMPGGGKNSARKGSGLGPFLAATKEDAEAARNKALNDWLHAPVKNKRQKVADTSTSASGSSQVQPAARPKRGAAPSSSASLKEARPKAPQTLRSAGPGCVLRHPRCRPPSLRTLPALRTLSATALASLTLARAASQARTRQRHDGGGARGAATPVRAAHRTPRIAARGG